MHQITMLFIARHYINYVFSTSLLKKNSKDGVGDAQLVPIRKRIDSKNGCLRTRSKK